MRCHVCHERSYGYWGQTGTGALELLAQGERLRSRLPVCARCAYPRTRHVHCGQHAARTRGCVRCDKVIEAAYATPERMGDIPVEWETGEGENPGNYRAIRKSLMASYERKPPPGFLRRGSHMNDPEYEIEVDDETLWPYGNDD